MVSDERLSLTTVQLWYPDRPMFVWDPLYGVIKKLGSVKQC